MTIISDTENQLPHFPWCSAYVSIPKRTPSRSLPGGATSGRHRSKVCICDMWLAASLLLLWWWQLVDLNMFLKEEECRNQQRRIFNEPSLISDPNSSTPPDSAHIYQEVGEGRSIDNSFPLSTNQEPGAESGAQDKNSLYAQVSKRAGPTMPPPLPQVEGWGWWWCTDGWRTDGGGRQR